LSQGDIEIE